MGYGAEMISGEMMGRERLMLGDEAARWEDVREYINGSEAFESGQRRRLVGSGAGLLGRAYNLATSIFKSLASFSKERLPGFLLPATGSQDISSAPQFQNEIETEVFFVPRSRLATLKSVVCASIASAVSSPSDGQSPSYIPSQPCYSPVSLRHVNPSCQRIPSKRALSHSPSPAAAY